MNERLYREIFQELGIYCPEINGTGSDGNAMKYRGNSLGLYYCRSRGGVEYFSANLNDRHLYPEEMWDWSIDPNRVKRKDRPESNRHPIRPRPGMERRAFRSLCAP